ncbi:hypothetical protein [Comamonas testosteroni]|uniref:hypothetical protein n=1 Tax=Comamonas testosteroni TaxID=285 RepID=UPI0012D736A4|nr:hypothetical protein [Comamonas testosteroni]
MRKFLSRADRLFDYVVGVDGFFVNKKIKPATVKDIFDNLRYYTVLGFLWVGIKALWKDDSNIAFYAALVLSIVTAGLLLLVAAQTALVILMSTAGWVTMLLPPRVAVRARARLRKDDWSVKAALLALMCPVLISAWLVATGLIGALSRTGVL